MDIRDLDIRGWGLGFLDIGGFGHSGLVSEFGHSGFLDVRGFWTFGVEARMSSHINA